MLEDDINNRTDSYVSWCVTYIHGYTPVNQVEFWPTLALTTKWWESLSQPTGGTATKNHEMSVKHICFKVQQSIDL